MKTLITIITAIFTLSALAQTPHQYVAKGDKELFDGYPQSALFYYKLALKADTHMVAANFMTAEAYRAQRNYKRAANFYQSTASLDEQDEFPEALYWLGVMQKQMGQYREAKRSIQGFLAIYRQRDDFYRAARDEVSSCDWAIEHLNDTAFFEVLTPDSGLNTIHAEMSPILVDSNTLYFATMRYDSEIEKKNDPAFVELKKAVKDSNMWSLVELDLPIQDANAHVGNGSFSADSTRFYYSNCSDRNNCNIYQISKDDGAWGLPEKLGNPVNENGSSNTQPMIASFDGKEYLYFASNRKTGKGGYDIWFVEVKKGIPTTRLRNMGTRVNSKGNEITPWFDASDTTFYYSSNQQLGFGGYDVFKSKGEPGRSNPTENAGTDVNSPADDYYFTFRMADSLGYFASNRISGTKNTENETCCNDLYKVRIKPIIEDTTPSKDTVVAEVINDTTVAALDTFVAPTTIEQVQDLLPISLYFHNDRPDPRTMNTTTSLTYGETVDEYVTLKQEYLYEISQSTISDSMKNAMYEKTRRFFNSDLTGSLKRVDAALKVLLEELESGSDVTIAVKGYASPLANSEYNLNLTYRRIDAMENYIRQYAEGSFLPYLENDTATAKLTIEKIPYGESKASAAISDSGNDRLNAIYSPSAAKERRIEILRVERD